MASISHNKENGHRTIQFYSDDGKRCSIRLGKVTKRIAETIRLHVERLHSALASGHVVDDDTLRWLAEIDDRLHRRLVAAGLAQTRERATLAAFVDGYIAKRTDVKERTRLIFVQTRNALVRFFGEDRDLRTITRGDAEDFRRWLFAEGAADGRALATNTVNDRCKKSKQFFNAAVRAESEDRPPRRKGNAGDSALRGPGAVSSGVVGRRR